MRFVTAVLMSVVMAGAAWADPVEGTWKTQVDDDRYAHVKMEPCGPAICGVIVKTFLSGDDYVSPNLGKKLVLDMVPAGEGKYKGKVWRPSNGKIYVGKMDVAGNSLKLSGCVAGGLICSKQTWTRLK
jgi:uncharacterized protein (DUF2147 family)